VAEILANKGFQVFLPLYFALHCWKDRTKRLSLPLFPCYVFLREGLERRLAVLTTPGVHGLVSFCGRPSPIPQHEIDAVRRMVEKGTHCEPHPYLKCGDWVRVKTGPLAGLEGVLVRKKNLFRLVISVELLQQSVAIEVEATAVERATRQPARLSPSSTSWSVPALA
jgi:transcription termination/antitermination protein NusG